MFKKNKKQQSFQIDQQEISTIIGEGYIFTGEVQGSSVIRIEGKIIGNVNVEAGVILGEKGVIDGNITSQSVIVFGTVNGNVKTTQLEIKKSGHVNGDIATDTVEIELGAHYNGKLAMVPQQQQLKEAS
jgi:cytoskeletal protein CcmA (bactofilin family)